MCCLFGVACCFCVCWKPDLLTCLGMVVCVCLFCFFFYQDSTIWTPKLQETLNGCLVVWFGSFSTDVCLHVLVCVCVCVDLLFVAFVLFVCLMFASVCLFVCVLFVGVLFDVWFGCSCIVFACLCLFPRLVLSVRFCVLFLLN